MRHIMRKHIVFASLLCAATIAAAGSAFAAPVMQGPVNVTRPVARFPYPGPLHEVYGVVRAINGNGNTVTLQTRRGIISVDASWANAAERITPLFVSRPVIVRGVFVRNTLFANEIGHNNHPALAEWPADR